MKSVACFVVAGLSAVIAAGCGSAKEEGPPEGDVALLRNLVSQMPDASNNPKSFRTFFTADAQVPGDADRKRFGKLYFDVVGSPAMNGDVATVKVQVRDERSPTPPGQVEWTFVKEGDRWKLKAAPLP